MDVGGGVAKVSGKMWLMIILKVRNYRVLHSF